MNNLPLVLYNNILRSGTVTASSQTVSEPAVYVSDWHVSTRWLPAVDGVSTLTFDSGVGNTATANAFALYRHTLHVTGGTVAVEWSDDGVAWFDLLLPFTPVSARVVFITFAGKTARYFRISVDETPAGGLGLVALGETLEIDNGFRIGYSAPHFSRNVRTKVQQSETGLWIGSSTIDKGITGVFRIHDVDEFWAYDFLLPFIEHAERFPFFMLWNELDYPDRAAIIRSVEKRIPPFSYSHYGRISGGFKYNGWE